MGILLFFLSLILVISFRALSAEFYLVEPVKGAFSADDYFDRLGIGNIYRQVECAKDGKTCWVYLVNHRGRVLAGGYNTESNSVYLLGKSRFRNFTSAFVRRDYKVGKEYYTEWFMLYDNGTRVKFNKNWSGSEIAFKPLPNGNLIVITRRKMFEVSGHGLVFERSLPMEIEGAYVGNNPGGVVSGVAWGGNSLLFFTYAGEDSPFLIDYEALTSSGDRDGILSIYPEKEDLSYAVVYRYVNPYNKGLVLYELDFDRGAFRKGHLFNSEDRNVGFDPSVFSTGDKVVVSAENSTDKTQVHFVITKEDLKKLGKVKPLHIKGFEGENNFELLFSLNFSALTWNAYSEVRKGDTTYAKVKYDMNNSLFYGSSIEGRVGETQIAITYLQNKAERKGGLAAETSRYLSAVVDFHGLVGRRRLLRIGYERGKINGIAKFTDELKSTTRSEVFKTDLKSYYIYLMGERGFYYGLEYLNYKIPSTVGFSSGGSVVFYTFDKDFTLNSLLLSLGYDHVSYAKRYETNYRSTYIAGSGGLGLGLAEVSASVKDRAKAITGIGDIQVPLYIVAKAHGEAGYLFQSRAKVLKGFGFSINFGYRLTFMFVGAGSDSGAPADKLYLELSRYEFLHGPFLRANVIF